MNPPADFHILTIGWIEDIGDLIARRSGIRFSYIAHPRYTGDSPGPRHEAPTYFVRERLRQPLPEPDLALLASLEREGVPTVQTMILSDRVVSKIAHRDALSYATLLARRFSELFTQLAPSVVIASFDGLHSAIALGVARKMGFPWFAMNFSVIPPGLTCLCDAMSPNARVHIHAPDRAQVRAFAEQVLSNFENRAVRVPAHITPPGLSLAAALKKLPARVKTALDTFARAKDREFLQVTEDVTDLSVGAAMHGLARARAARKAVQATRMIAEPPKAPYLFFGLHTQPESSIDVWAPFYANQLSVLEALVRAMPVSHRLLVKIHKSDAVNYSAKELARMQALPGLDLVLPFADSRRFVDQADMIISIQGTMGLEAALLGKPVIMLGDSPVVKFPSAARIGELSELPALIRRMLERKPPARSAILDAYTDYLSPFLPAVHNDWTVRKTDAEIDKLVVFFRTLQEYMSMQPARRKHGAG